MPLVTAGQDPNKITVPTATVQDLSGVGMHEGELRPSRVMKPPPELRLQSREISPLRSGVPSKFSSSSLHWGSPASR